MSGNHKLLIFIWLLCLLSITTYSQTSSIYKDADNYYFEGVRYFDLNNFGLAKVSFEKSSDQLSTSNNEKSRLLKSKSEFMAAKAALFGKHPEGEKLILAYYENHRPDPLSYLALFEIADLRYNQKRYSEAINLFEKIDPSVLSEELATEVFFKKGYCYFVKKQFQNAENALSPILGKDSEYYYESYYYLAMVQFFQGKYERALENFFIIENYPTYKSRIPYYIAQIYFAEEEYDEIATYLPAQLNQSQLKNKNEIRHILGQTYYLLGSYDEALPHLEHHEKNSRKMRKEDFYQLAFTQYQLGHFAKAASNFKELSKLDSKLGQVSNNYLADCYLKLDKKEEARVSFKNVINYDYDTNLKEEAILNYGKISSDLGYDRSAINALLELSSSSLQYNQAQLVLASLFETSKDYGLVISTIESMSFQSPKIKEAYQKVCLEQGMLMIKDGKYSDAKAVLQKGVRMPINNLYSSLSYFYLADIFFAEQNYDQSIDYINKYFTLSSMVEKLPLYTTAPFANYTQAYNYLKKNEIRIALDFFNKAIVQLNAQDFSNTKDIRARRMYADILNRIGDCYFKENNYSSASKSYAQAAEIDFSGRDYALFQNSMIKGLIGNHFEKIVLLENLIRLVPNSSFIDDAYFQLGETQLFLGNSREAELSFRKILDLKRSTSLRTRSLLKLGLIAYNKGDNDLAIEYYTSLLNSNPNRTEATEAIVALEEIYIQDLGDAEGFVKIIEDNTGYELSSLEKDSLSFMVAEGRFENGEYNYAIESYSKYLENYPKGFNRLKALYNRAESRTILKDYENALPDYERIIEVGQNDYYEDAIYKSALISYNYLEKFEKAFNYYNLLSEVTRDNILKYEAQVGGLKSAYRAGDLDATLVMANLVINNEMANKEDKALAYFYSGKMSYLIKSWDQALANLNQVAILINNAYSAEAQYLINDIYFKKGDFIKAEEVTLETISNTTSYPYWVAKNLILMSDIFMTKKDVFNAKAALEAVIENFSESEDIINEAKEKLAIVLIEEEKSNRILENDDTIKLDTIGNNE